MIEVEESLVDIIRPLVPTVKAEVHGTTDISHNHENSDSDSGAEATRRDHHYEDIYLPREEHQRRRYLMTHRLLLSRGINTVYSV